MKNLVISFAASSRVLLQRLVRLIYLWKYGRRGGIKPPLGFGPWTQPTIAQQIAYQYRVRMWRMESAIYDWTGLPEEWLGAYENTPFSA